MRLTVLGSGSAFSTCGCNAGYLVDGRVLVDCGAPVPSLVRRAGTSVRGLTLILLTHFHADHSFVTVQNSLMQRRRVAVKTGRVIAVGVFTGVEKQTDDFGVTMLCGEGQRAVTLL